MRLTFSRRASIGLAIGAAAFLLAGVGEGVAPGVVEAGEPAAQPRPKIAVSKETTFITGPLTKDGYVDYRAALNALGSKGVTPQNNAAMLVCQAFGPARIPREKREHVAKLLGMQCLPEKGKYFEESGPFVRRSLEGLPRPASDEEKDPVETAESRFEKARRRPWSREEFPLVEAWLAENEKPLETMIAATKRPRFFFPLLEPGGSVLLGPTFLPMDEELGVVRALVTRAMFRLNAGKTDEAWQDLVACHRLARLVGQGPTIFHGRWSYAIDRIACEADAVLADGGEVSAEQARRFGEDLRRLPPLPRIAEKLAAGERLAYLEVVSARARLGRAGFMRLTSPGSEDVGWGAALVVNAVEAMVDWDESMRTINTWYDRFVEACTRPARAERERALKKTGLEVERIPRETGSFRSFVGDAGSRSLRRAMGRQVGLAAVVQIFAEITEAAAGEDHAAAYSSMGQVAVALAAYRADHGAYPAGLAQLCPKYLASLPRDPFVDGPLRYRRAETGYVVYSVGPNGEDDGGKNWHDDADDSVPEDADDIAITVPRPEKK